MFGVNQLTCKSLYIASARTHFYLLVFFTNESVDGMHFTEEFIEERYRRHSMTNEFIRLIRFPNLNIVDADRANVSIDLPFFGGELVCHDDLFYYQNRELDRFSMVYIITFSNVITYVDYFEKLQKCKFLEEDLEQFIEAELLSDYESRNMMLIKRAKRNNTKENLMIVLIILLLLFTGAILHHVMFSFRDSAYIMNENQKLLHSTPQQQQQNIFDIDKVASRIPSAVVWSYNENIENIEKIEKTVNSIETKAASVQLPYFLSINDIRNVVSTKRIYEKNQSVRNLLRKIMVSEIRQRKNDICVSDLVYFRSHDINCSGNCFEYISACMQDNTKQFTMIPVVYQYAELDDSPYHHASVVMLNHVSKEVELYDPNGWLKRGIPEYAKMIENIKAIAKAENYTFIGQVSFGLQSLERTLWKYEDVKASDLHNGLFGMCETWSMWWIHTRLLNATKSAAEIDHALAHLIAERPLALYEFLMPRLALSVKFEYEYKLLPEKYFSKAYSNYLSGTIAVSNYMLYHQNYREVKYRFYRALQELNSDLALTIKESLPFQYNVHALRNVHDSADNMSEYIKFTFRRMQEFVE